MITTLALNGLIGIGSRKNVPGENASEKRPPGSLARENPPSHLEIFPPHEIIYFLV